MKFSHPAINFCNPETGEYNDDLYDKETTLTVPAHYEVCPSCHGEGHHDRRDIDTSLLVDGMMEDGDYEGIDEYFDGGYDVLCDECHGRNVVLVPDLPEWAITLLVKYSRDEAAENAYARMEARMTGGY